MAAILFLVTINWQWQQGVYFVSHLTHRTTLYHRQCDWHNTEEKAESPKASFQGHAVRQESQNPTL